MNAKIKTPPFQIENKQQERIKTQKYNKFSPKYCSLIKLGDKTVSSHKVSNCHKVENKSPSQLMEELIKEVKKHSEPNKKKIALTKFLQTIYQNKHLLVMPSYILFPDYEEIHQQALQDTILVVSQKIDSYQSDKPILPWIIGIFKHKFYDALKKHKPKEVNILSLDSLDYAVSDRSEAERKDNNLRDFLKSDPENILRTTTVRGCPHITLQKLLWLIAVEDLSWETVAKSLDSNISTLSSFYQRNIKKHRAYFKKYLSS